MSKDIRNMQCPKIIGNLKLTVSKVFLRSTATKIPSALFCVVHSVESSIFLSASKGNFVMFCEFNRKQRDVKIVNTERGTAEQM